ncbi:unnamed protein product [Rhodiola kirilowii]
MVGKRRKPLVLSSTRALLESVLNSDSERDKEEDCRGAIAGAATANRNTPITEK